MRALTKQIGAGVIGVLAGGVLVATMGGGADAADQPVVGTDRAAIEAVVRDYILAHPEIIPEAMSRLQNRETAKLLDSNRKALETPFAAAWAGAPNGDVTLVMFTDYSCGYCRASVADVDRLLAEDKKLKVVWRELPILGPGSDIAARGGLAAAQQGKFLAFHRAMFAAGSPTEAKLANVIKASGLDADRAARDAASAAAGAEVETNIELARKLGLTGTPSFVVGDKLMAGAVGYDELKKAIAEARAAKG